MIYTNVLFKSHPLLLTSQFGQVSRLKVLTIGWAFWGLFADNKDRPSSKHLLPALGDSVYQELTFIGAQAGKVNHFRLFSVQVVYFGQTKKQYT